MCNVRHNKEAYFVSEVIDPVEKQPLLSLQPLRLLLELDDRTVIQLCLRLALFTCQRWHEIEEYNCTHDAFEPTKVLSKPA